MIKFNDFHIIIKHNATYCIYSHIRLTFDILKLTPKVSVFYTWVGKGKGKVIFGII